MDAIPQLFAKDTGHLGVNYVAVDYDAEDEMVYFSDIRNFAIMKAKVDGSLRKAFRYKLWKFILKLFKDIHAYVLALLSLSCTSNLDIYVGICFSNYFDLLDYKIVFKENHIVYDIDLINKS